MCCCAKRVIEVAEMAHDRFVGGPRVCRCAAMPPTLPLQFVLLVCVYIYSEARHYHLNKEARRVEPPKEMRRRRYGAADHLAASSHTLRPASSRCIPPTPTLYKHHPCPEQSRDRLYVIWLYLYLDYSTLRPHSCKYFCQQDCL